MTELKTAQEMLAAGVAGRETEDPEIASLKRAIKLLDKTAKSNRTYGSKNPVAQKFSQQLFEELNGHLSTYSRLTLLVQRSELLYRHVVVYQADKDIRNESIAFRLYSDGIRELTFDPTLTREDLQFFLDSLWSDSNHEEDDDDIVTRLWSRNLSTISLVTAEEVARATVDDLGSPSTEGSMSSSDSTLRELLDRERRKIGTRIPDGASQDSGGSSNRSSRFQSGLVGYEVTEEELAALAQEIEAESKLNNLLHIMDILTAILAFEKSPALLTKLIDLWGNIVDSLLQVGNWTVLENVFGLLHETDFIRPDLSDDHKQQVASLLDNLGRAERVKAIETYLNRTPEAKTEGLSTILLLMKPTAIPALCSLLANLESPSHQAIVSEALVVLARDQSDPLLKGLSDRRPTYVRNLLSILVKWNNPKFGESVEKLVRHQDAQVRKEAIRAVGLLRPSGNGEKLVACVGDEDEGVRIATLKLLTSGQYTAPFSLWSPILTEDRFNDRPMSERRAVFHAVRATCGDEAVSFWEGLLTEWSWTNRKKKEESALLAAEALGKLATPMATAALELGIKKGGAAVRQACTMALFYAKKLQREKPSTNQDQ